MLQELLGRERFYVLGILDSLYAFASVQTKDGNLQPHDEEEIAEWIGYPDDPYELIAYLRQSGWIVDGDEGVFMKTVAKESRRTTKQRRPSQRVMHKYSEAFELFWKIYPRRERKKKAYESYLKEIDGIVKARGKSVDEAEEMINVKAGEYAEMKKGSAIEFIAHPTTWLNQGGYEDEYAKPTNGKHTEDWLEGF